MSVSDNMDPYDGMRDEDEQEPCRSGRGRAGTAPFRVMTHRYAGHSAGRRGHKCWPITDSWREVPNGWVCAVEFADGTRLSPVKAVELESLGVDERPSYIEPPERAFGRVELARVEASLGVAPGVPLRAITPGSRAMHDFNERLADLGEVTSVSVSIQGPRYAVAKVEVLMDFEKVQALRQGRGELLRRIVQCDDRFNNAGMPATKEKAMKTKHHELLAALQAATMTTVEAVFPENVGGTSSKGYTYKVPKAWGVKAGDQLVVDTPTGTRVVLVREAHAAARIEPGINYKWAVSRIDRSEHADLVGREEAFLAELEEVERLHRAKELTAKAGEALGANTPARRKFDRAVRALQG